MSKSTAPRARVDSRLHDDDEDDAGENTAMPTITDNNQGKRLRNAILVANLIAWVVIVILVKWFIL
jgi:hypothetical protein